MPAGVAYDAAGDLFIADAHRNQVFEVSLAGVTTVVAGTGVQGFGGDGGAATQALLNAPASVAVGADGTLYIADSGNQRIRAVVSGQMRTVAGNGAKGFGGDGGDALTALLSTPLAVAVDAGDGVLIADSGNQRLRRLFSGALSTVAGTGVQGFSGDGAAATLAQLDTPSGVAVASDGRIFIADARNHRIRVIVNDGTITTFAGTGKRGYDGDGGAANMAALNLPRGIAVTAVGEVIFADSDNQRLRMVNANGTITTIAGSGVQGSSSRGAVAAAASLDSPRGVAVSSFTAPVFADAHNHVVQEVAADADLYAVAGASARAVMVTLSVPAQLTYGQGVISATVSGSAPAVQGNIVLLDGASALRTATLSNGTAMLPVDGLNAGQHTLSATFQGDGLHQAAASAATNVTVAAAVATATAQPATMSYGGAAPSLSGTVTGILARDTASVTASFTANASDLAPVGSYPIGATLAGPGSANYALVTAPTSGFLQVVPAAVVITLAPQQNSYAGLPLTLSAAVTPPGRGTPTGSVTFLDNGVSTVSGSVASGSATAVYLSPVPGTHSITAVYAGDHNFLGATSAAVQIAVNAMPDFTLGVSGSMTQTVQGGALATYGLTVMAQPAPFSGAVSLSASGLPTGAVATFSPATVIPGASSVPVTLAIQTSPLAMNRDASDVTLGICALFGIGGLLPLWRRRGWRDVRGVLLVAAVALALLSSTGCGDRSFATSPRSSQSFPMVVTATGTNLAGAVVTHTTTITLVVQ